MKNAEGGRQDDIKGPRAEPRLGESEALFRLMSDAAPVLVWMSGPDKLCTFFNKPWLEFTGRSLEQELGNGWAEGVYLEGFERSPNLHRGFRRTAKFPHGIPPAAS